MQRVFLGALVLAAAIAAAGCDNTVSNTPTGPPQTTTDTFTGTINVNGGATHTFNVAVAGSVTATLTTVSPDATVQVGFLIGTWNAVTASCQQSIAKDDAVQGVILSGNASGPGTLCTRIYDTGKLTGAINYTITVVHP